MYDRFAESSAEASAITVRSEKQNFCHIKQPKGTTCIGYIKDLLGTISSKHGKVESFNVLDLFDRVAREGNFILKKLKKDHAGESGFNGNKRVVYIKPLVPSGNEQPELIEHYLNGYAVTVLNELMHHARKSGVYTDAQLADAAFRVLTPADQLKNPLPKSTDVESNSKYFHPFLNSHCRSVTGE